VRFLASIKGNLGGVDLQEGVKLMDVVPVLALAEEAAAGSASSTARASTSRRRSAWLHEGLVSRSLEGELEIRGGDGGDTAEL
jgi:hypothetical protein